MARPMWQGAISFGLVTVPVKMYAATGDHSVNFRQFERGTSDRIRYRRVNERTGKEVDYQDIVKGYELGGSEYVIVEPQELDEIAPGRSRTIDIDAFVHLEEIDPVYFSRSYWLAPAKDEYVKPYSLLMQAMRGTEKAAIARFVMRAKEYIAAIRAGDDLMILDTLRFAEDIRNPAEELGSLPQQASVKDKERQMAETLIDSMTEEWVPEDYPDTYTERVMELIESKAKGRSVVAESEPPGPTKVVDLFDALQRSVSGSGGDGSRGKGSDGKRSGGKRGKASASSNGQEPGELSKSELESKARELDIKGRSKMTRAELVDAVSSATAPRRRKKAS